MEQWVRKQCCLKIFVIQSFIGPFVQGHKTICALLVECIIRNISVKLFGSVVQEEVPFKDISSRALAALLFN